MMTIIRQWIAGLAFAVLLVVALVRTTNDIELTYEPGREDAGAVVVRCSPDQALRLRSDGGEPLHHRVLEGDEVIQEHSRTDSVVGRPDTPFNVRRGIDLDCLRAESQRTVEVVWWIAGSMLCAIVFAMARLRRPLPPSWDQFDGLDARAFDRAPVDTTLERYRTRR